MQEAHINGSIGVYFTDATLLKIWNRRQKRSILSRVLRPSRGFARHVRKAKATNRANSPNQC
jgi:hypothetical protein